MTEEIKKYEEIHKKIMKDLVNSSEESIKAPEESNKNHGYSNLKHIKTSIKEFENQNEYSELRHIVDAAQEELQKLNNPSFGKKIYNLFTQGNKKKNN